MLLFFRFAQYIKLCCTNDNRCLCCLFLSVAAVNGHLKCMVVVPKKATFDYSYSVSSFRRKPTNRATLFCSYEKS